VLNHFPNFYELTRKDLMAKNIRRYRKDAERQLATAAGGAASGGSALAHLDIIPKTFTLPADLSLFAEEFKRQPQSTWIVKPHAKSQGQGVFLVSRLAEIRRWLTQLWEEEEEAAAAAAAASLLAPGMGGSAAAAARETFVVSRYVERPLLIGGKKFDLRLYVLVTSYRPLKFFLYEDGFARFCNVKYSARRADLDNRFVHLTNVAVQKHGDEYNAAHGNKWHVRNLRLFVEGTRGQQAAQRLFSAIHGLIYHSLRAVQGVIVSDRHCFECYGYDVLVDADLKPWLLEVNASPSLTVTTEADRALKTKLIHDILRVVLPPGFPREPLGPEGTSWNKARRVGDFVLLFDEARDALPAFAGPIH
jgi:tubulin polyglutamylase TTLL1